MVSGQLNIQNVAELRGLLQAALNDLSIRPRVKYLPVISSQEYKARVLAAQELNRRELSETVWRYSARVADGTLKQAISDVLETSLGGAVDGGRVQMPLIVTGIGFGNGFEIGTLVDKVAQLALLYGPDKAAKLFVQSVDQPTCTIYSCHLLSGVSISESFDLTDGIRLYAVSRSTSEFPTWIPYNIFESIPAMRFMGATILVLKQHVRPRYWKPVLGDTPDWEEDVTVDVASSGMPNFDVRKFCRSLSMVCEFNVEAAVNWTHVPIEEVANVGLGGGEGFSYSTRFGAGGKTVDVAALESAYVLSESIDALDQATATRLRVPIGRWLESLKGKELVDQMIDIGIALESLYVNESGSELKYRLRTRASRHLREEASGQREVVEWLDAAYDLRSEAVHMGEFRRKQKRVGGVTRPHEEVVEMARGLCKEGILKVVRDRQLPDWRAMAL